MNYERDEEKFYVTIPAGESKVAEAEISIAPTTTLGLRLFAYHGDEQIFVNGGPSDSAHPEACPSES